MTNSVSSPRFGAYTNLGKTQVDSWKTKENANDCYWNIAKNQLGDNASNSEIQKVMNELIELNASKNNTTGKYNTVVHENQEVLLDLQSTIKQSSQEIQKATQNYDTVKGKFSDLTAKLTSANSSYLSSLSAYQQAKASGDEESIKTAYSAYIQALNEMMSLKDELAGAQQDLISAQAKVDELQNALNQLKEEYEQKENLNKELKNEFDQEITNFENDISAKQKELDSIKQTAQQEAQSTQTYNDAALESGMINKDENGNLIPKTQEELSTVAKTVQIENLKAQYAQVQDEQGCVGKFWNGVKNLFGTKYSSKNIEKTIEKVEKGEMTAQEAQKIIGEYQQRQKSGVNTVTSVLTGIAVVGSVALAPVTGGASLALGLAVGGGTRVGLKTLDRATNNIKGDELDKKEMVKDAVIGSVEGAVTVATMGMGNAALQTSKETGKVLVKESVKAGTKAGAKAGAIDGAVTNAATYMADVAVGDTQFSGVKLLETTTQGAAIGGVAGGVMGGAASGVQAYKAGRSSINYENEVLDAVRKEQDQAVQEFGETAISAESMIKEGFEEKVADGQIANLDDALEFYSEKELKDAGLYDRFIQNADNEGLDVVQKVQTELTDSTQIQEVPDIDNSIQNAAQNGDDVINQTIDNSDVIELDGLYFQDESTGQMYKLKKLENRGFSREIIDPDSIEYQNAMKKVYHMDDGAQASKVANKPVDIDPDELCRVKGNDGKPIPANYLNNQTDVRRHLNDAIESGEYIKDVNAYKNVMNEAHELAYAGKSGNNLYYSKKGSLLNPEELKPGQIRTGGKWSSNYEAKAFEVQEIAKLYDDPFCVTNKQSVVKLEGISIPDCPSNLDTKHFYPRGDVLDVYYEQMYKTSKEALALIETGASEREILAKIANHYQYAVNARPYTQINNSLFMNEVNTLLQKANMPTMPQGYLDHIAQRLQPENFVKFFIDTYNSTNLGSLKVA